MSAVIRPSIAAAEPPHRRLKSRLRRRGTGAGPAAAPAAMSAAVPVPLPALVSAANGPASADVASIATPSLCSSAVAVIVNPPQMLNVLALASIHDRSTIHACMNDGRSVSVWQDVLMGSDSKGSD